MELLKLDLGCGKNKAGPEWTGVDCRAYPGVDLQLNLCVRWTRSAVDQVFKPWPWDDNSVDEARASHYVEHLEPDERIHFANEAYRILKPGCSIQVITPHWSSCRAYGDLTHKWPPVSEFWFYYLKRGWREENAPHNDEYTCNFETTWGHSLHPHFHTRNPEQQQFATSWYKEACQDMIATLTKLG